MRTFGHFGRNFRDDGRESSLLLSSATQIGASGFRPNLAGWRRSHCRR